MMQFAKDYPGVKSLAAGVEAARLDGALDVHVHADPCSLIARSQDYTEVALACARAGMRAVVRKDHHYWPTGEAQPGQRTTHHMFERGELAIRPEDNGATGRAAFGQGKWHDG